MPFDSDRLFGRTFARVMWHENKITTVGKVCKPKKQRRQSRKKAMRQGSSEDGFCDTIVKCQIVRHAPVGEQLRLVRSAHTMGLF